MQLTTRSTRQTLRRVSDAVLRANAETVRSTQTGGSARTLPGVSD
ncbi:MAG TPA: hypothetical protein PLB21_13450 [Actinomycetota bacterium]|nr:hypothetical protein [Actinomycetota bacterium]